MSPQEWTKPTLIALSSTELSLGGKNVNMNEKTVSTMAINYDPSGQQQG